MYVPTCAQAVSRGHAENVRMEAPDGDSEPVPHVLKAASEHGVVEGVTDVVFDHAQSLAGSVGRGVEYATEVRRLGWVGQDERFDLVGQWDRRGFGRGGLVDPRDERLESQARRRQQSRDWSRRGDEAGQQVLGADQTRAVGMAGLVRGVAENRMQLGRVGQGGFRRCGFEERRFRHIEQFEDSAGIETVLAQQQRRSTFGLVDERREEILRLDPERPTNPRPRERAIERSLGPWGVRLEHGDGRPRGGGASGNDGPLKLCRGWEGPRPWDRSRSVRRI